VRGISVGPDEGITIVGYTSENIRFAVGEPNETVLAMGSGLRAGLVVRYDGQGGFAWVRQIAGSNQEQALGCAAHADGSVSVCGYLTSATILGAGEPTEVTIPVPVPGAGAPFFARYEADGQLRFAFSPTYPPNGLALDVEALPGGAALVLGVGGGVLDHGGPNETTVGGYWVAAYTATGALLWARRVHDGISTPGMRLSVADDSSFAIAGNARLGVVAPGTPFEESLPNRDAPLLVRFDAAGQYLWHRVGQSPLDLPPFADVQLGPDGSATVLTAVTAAHPVSFDDGDGGTVTVSDQSDNISQVLLRYDSHGDLQWVNPSTGGGYAFGTALAVLPDASVAVLGNASTSAPAILGAGQPCEEAIGGQGGPHNGYLARYTADGALAWAETSYARFDDSMLGVGPEGELVLASRANASPPMRIPGTPDGVFSYLPPSHLMRNYLVRYQPTDVVPVPVTLACVGDTYVRQGHPNQNQGAETYMRVRANGHNRALVAFDQGAIEDAVGGTPVVSAKLRLYIVDNRDNWGDGRMVSVHRMTTRWTEEAATWNCPDDQDLGNGKPDGDEWAMNGGGSGWPFLITPTGSVLHTEGLLGWIEFDVTADVQAFLGGTADNFGWILKKDEEGQPGRVDYTSREAGAYGPELLLTFE
jgi:hypothetical protein